MPTFEITETVKYSILADSEDQAMRMYENADLPVLPARFAEKAEYTFTSIQQVD